MAAMDAPELLPLALAHIGSPVEAYTFVTDLGEFQKRDDVCMRYFGLASCASLVLTS